MALLFWGGQLKALLPREINALHTKDTTSVQNIDRQIFRWVIYKLQKHTSYAGSAYPTLKRYSSRQSPVYQPPAAMCYSVIPENITYTECLLADQVFSSHLNVGIRA